jgi:vacuolar iron transporter family protein
MIINNYLLRSLIYGGIDGIITIFNIISGISGAKLNLKYVFILGFSVLIADGLSMGLGDYMSIKADKKYKQTNKYDYTNENTVIPLNNALITFVSFVVFGFIPLFIFFGLNKLNIKNKYLNTYFSVMIALFILGILQSKYTKEKWYISSTQLVLYGSMTSFLAYNISSLISKTNFF